MQNNIHLFPELNVFVTLKGKRTSVFAGLENEMSEFLKGFQCVSGCRRGMEDVLGHHLIPGPFQDRQKDVRQRMLFGI